MSSDEAKKISEATKNLTKEPFTKPNQVLKFLDKLIEAWEKEERHRVVFAITYSVTTKHIIHKIDNSDNNGYFEDPKWMSKYLVEFANKYREAIFNYEDENKRSEVPDAWKVAFSISESDDHATVQHLLLGILAHIGHDLPRVLISVLKNETDLDSKLKDHQKTGEILINSKGEITDKIQKTGRAQAWDEIDKWLRNWDDLITMDLFERMRNGAWDVANERIDEKKYLLIFSDVEKWAQRSFPKLNDTIRIWNPRGLTGVLEDPNAPLKK